MKTWWQHGLCLGDLESFVRLDELDARTSEGIALKDRLRERCTACPVLAECRADVLSRPVVHGANLFQAGLTEFEQRLARYPNRKRHHRPRTSTRPTQAGPQAKREPLPPTPCARCGTEFTPSGVPSLRPDHCHRCRRAERKIDVELLAGRRLHGPWLRQVICADCHEPCGPIKATGYPPAIVVDDRAVCRPCARAVSSESAAGPHPAISTRVASTDVGVAS